MDVVGVLPFLIVVIVVAVLVVAGGVPFVLLLRSQRQKARAAGYPSLTAYLGAAPQTDEQKRDAADLALKGLVICLLGLLFPPLLLFGLIPFFYGARKVIYASMGLGLADEPDRQAQ